MKSPVNEVNIKGLIYDHNLKMRVAGPGAKNPGTEFINGELKIATDRELINIVSIRYAYVTKYTKSDSLNQNYIMLSKIINGEIPTVMNDGIDVANGIYTVRSKINVSDWWDRNDPDRHIMNRINDGGFLNRVGVMPPEGDIGEATFHADVVVTNATRFEADPEKNTKERVVLKGAVFDSYNRALIPVEFVVTQSEAMRFFESLDPSGTNPVFTRVRGNQVSNTIIQRVEEESAWGAPFVREVPRKRKEYEVTWSMSHPYIWGDPETITTEELKEAISNRELYLASEKQRQQDYREKKKKEDAMTLKEQKKDIADGAFNYF